MTSQNKITNLLWIIIFCNTTSFFGYVYEEIVDIPNMLFASSNTVNEAWAAYHTVTNPGHYHALVSMVGMVSLILLWVNRKALSDMNFKKLKIATVLMIAATILTGIAVTQVNDFVFFGKPSEGSLNLKQLSILWASLNFVRLSLTLLAVAKLVSMFRISLPVSSSID